MNPFEVFNDNELKQINNAVGTTVENRDYTKDEWKMLEHSVLEDIMSRSSKNGDISKARNELDSVLTKIEKCRA